MYNSPEDFIGAIRSGLDRGNLLTAQSLAFQAVERYPEHEEIKRLAYLLAPPFVILGNPATEDRKVYRDWLKENHFKYRGRWVALFKGMLIAQAKDINELKLITCTCFNNREAEPPNPRSQVQPGNENKDNIEALPLIENGASYQLKQMLGDKQGVLTISIA